MTEDKADSQPTLVEKWIKDQQDWQRTWMEYFDSMVKNDEFLVHLGNAMRGSLLAGKPYPGSEAPAADADAEETTAAADERMDEALHALHRLQGDVADLKMTVEDLGAKLDQLTRLKSVGAAPPASAPSPTRRPAAATPPASAQDAAAPPAQPQASAAPPAQPVAGNLERGED